MKALIYWITSTLILIQLTQPVPAPLDELNINIRIDDGPDQSAPQRHPPPGQLQPPSRQPLPASDYGGYKKGGGNKKYIRNKYRRNKYSRKGKRGDFVKRDGELFFSPQAPDKEEQAIIEKIERKHPGSKLVEGDMLLTRDELKRRCPFINDQPKRNYRRKQVYPKRDCSRYEAGMGWDYQFAPERNRWPNRKLYYTFDENIDERIKEGVKAAIKDLSQNLANCITFEETDSSNNQHKVYIRSDIDKCWSWIGYKLNKDGPGRQDLDLSAWDHHSCFGVKVAEHELIHALGLYHQQARRDRDGYVTILWDNIIPKEKYNFNRTNLRDVYGLPYDYKSVLHYDQYTFHKGTALIRTIETKNREMQNVIGKQKKVSPQDFRQLKLLYECE